MLLAVFLPPVIFTVGFVILLALYTFRIFLIPPHTKQIVESTKTKKADEGLVLRPSGVPVFYLMLFSLYIPLPSIYATDGLEC